MSVNNLPYFPGDRARPFPILMSQKRPKTLSEDAPFLSCLFSEWQTEQNLRDTVSETHLFCTQFVAIWNRFNLKYDEITHIYSSSIL